ncbi:TPA: helix-turn-helix domain-containing protein [Streptococcus suis]|nr:helix-turn-helix domain-containing protein [Streptococcus suis]HEM3647483.1 helix-turn-helix domain-containing protein [Streptococcus suis]
MNTEQLAIYIGEKIRIYRKQKGWTQQELGKEIGMSKNAIGNYEKGFRSPKKDTLFKLANAFDISIDDLFPPIKKSDIDSTFKDSQSTNPQVEVIPSTLQKITATSSELEHKRQLVVLDTAEKQLEEQRQEVPQNNFIQFPKLFPYDYYDQPASAGTGQYLNDVKVEQIELPVDINADFVIPIYGNSMEPEYHSGDYVFVKLTYDLSDGDIGVFEYYGDAYIKQLVINDSGAFLHSLNSKYDDIPVDSDSDFRIIGKVVGNYSEK